MNKIFTGIGSRRTPPNELIKLKQICNRLYDLGFTLRSGGADGADVVCESVFPDRKEIYLPWKYFNKNQSTLYNVSDDAVRLAQHICKKYEGHAKWYIDLYERKESVQKLFGRNMYQVLGLNLDMPSDFVVTWYPNGGGTRIACYLAKDTGIPIINFYELSNDQIIDRINEILSK